MFFQTQGDVALSLPLVAHPRLTADMRFGSCRASTQIATQLLISANVRRNSKKTFFTLTNNFGNNMIKRIHSTLFLCKNINKTAEFYENLDFKTKKDDDAVRLIFGDFRLAFMDENKATVKDDPIAKKGVGMFMYFEVEKVDSFYEKLKEKNIPTSSEPKNWTWGKREFSVKDPDGYKLIFFSNI